MFLCLILFLLPMSVCNSFFLCVSHVSTSPCSSPGLSDGGIPQDHTEATAIHILGQVGPIHTQTVEPLQEEGWSRGEKT